MNCFRRIISYSSRKSLYNCHQSVNNILYCRIYTRIKVNEYLLDRSVPAKDVLNNLIDADSKELEDIKIYHEFLLSSGSRVPKVLKDEHYLELLCLSPNQRLKYYNHLATIEHLKLKKVKTPDISELDKKSHPSSKRFYTKYILSVTENTELNRLYQSIILGSQPFVFDSSFENTMSRQEIRNLSQQLLLCYNINKNMSEPFQMVFSNLNYKSVTYNDLKHAFAVGTPTCRFNTLEDLPMIFDKRSTADLYPDRRLIYLTPDSNKEFQEGEYDHDAVYICGAIVDKSNQLPLTLAKARGNNIEHRSFPIDRYLRWKNGPRSLTLDAVFTAMALARETNGDWKLAMTKAVPPRSLKDKSFTDSKKNFVR